MDLDDFAKACVGGHDTRPGCKICRDEPLRELIAGALARAHVSGRFVNVAAMHRKLKEGWDGYSFGSPHPLHRHLRECEGQS